MPKKGIYSEWQSKLSNQGFITVQFDKSGTGASSGRLSRQEELALLCVYSSLTSLGINFPTKYFLFTYAGGAEYFRYAYKSMKKAGQGVLPAGLIQLAALANWHSIAGEDRIPVLSVLGDTSLISKKIRKVLKRNALKSDTLSKVFLMPDSDQHLCHLPNLEENRTCHYHSSLFQTVFKWMETASEEYQDVTQEMEIEFDMDEGGAPADGR
ncbi:hypothetical protein ACFL5V_03445 [Fibrobacterota bacterium]